MADPDGSVVECAGGDEFEPAGITRLRMLVNGWNAALSINNREDECAGFIDHVGCQKRAVESTAAFQQQTPAIEGFRNPCQRTGQVGSLRTGKENGNAAGVQVLDMVVRNSFLEHDHEMIAVEVSGFRA